MFEQFFQQASDQLKLSFLDTILKKDELLREHFVTFYLQPRDKLPSMTQEDADEFICASKDLIKADLEDIRFDQLNINDYTTYPHKLVPKYDELDFMAEKEISSRIGIHVAEVERYCSIKHFDLAFLFMISIYRACLEAQLRDDYYAVTDPIQAMLGAFENHLQDCLPIFRSIQIPNDQLYTLTLVLFDQHKEIADKDPHFLEFFETYLYSLVHSGSDASIILDVMEDKNIEGQLPWLYVSLQRMTGGYSGFEKAALKYFTSNIHIAIELLEYYNSIDRSKYRNLAERLWNRGLFRHVYAERIFEILDPKEDSKLCLEIALYLNSGNYNEKYFKVIQQLMPEDERLAYLQTLKRNDTAYISALCMEGKNELARQHALLHTNRWNIVETVSPCLLADPEHGMAVLSQKVEELLQTERGRDFYTRIAKVLKVAKGIPVLQHQTVMLVNRILFANPRLRALKEELQVAGII